MLSQIRLYIVPPEPASLRALGSFRRLVDGPWAGRCDWRVIDALGEGAGTQLPRLPALARVEPAGLVWLPVDASARIPADAIDAAPGNPAGADAVSDVSAVWRAAVEAAPCAVALFAGNLLAYANASFRLRYALDEASLGRRPGEWGARGLEIDAALSGAPQPGVTIQRADAGAGSLVSIVHVASGGEVAARPLIDRIRVINHSIGNALVGVLGYGELLQRELEAAQSPSVARVRAMNEAAARLETLSQEISVAIRAYLQQPPS